MVLVTPYGLRIWSRRWSCLSDDLDLAVRSLGEGMQRTRLAIEMTERYLFRANGEVAETVHLLPVRSSVRGINLQVVQLGSAAARQEEGRGMPLKFQVLQVVVVTCQIQIHFMLAEQRIPIANQDRVISMHTVRVDRMMPHHGKERRRARALELGFEPSELDGLLLCRQGEAPPLLHAAVGDRHVAVEREKG